MFRVLIPIFHLNYVTGELRLARAGEIPFILLACIATAWYAARRLPLSRHPSHASVHQVPFLKRAVAIPKRSAKLERGCQL
jgi:hypothetical protein